MYRAQTLRQKTMPYLAIEGSFIVDKKIVCIDLCFVGFFERNNETMLRLTCRLNLLSLFHDISVAKTE